MLLVVFLEGSSVEETDINNVTAERVTVTERCQDKNTVI